MRKIEIPTFLEHLKVDDRGYPIPFFVGYIDGKPEFRLFDAKKQVLCLDKNLCPVCGLKNYKDGGFIITGPMGLRNQIATDPPMHRDCAEYSLKWCPHLYFEKADRRETGEVYQQAKVESEHTIITAKPKELFLVKCDKWKKVANPQGPGWLVRYRPIKNDRYYYESGTLVKQ